MKTSFRLIRNPSRVHAYVYAPSARYRARIGLQSEYFLTSLVIPMHLCQYAARCLRLGSAVSECVFRLGAINGECRSPAFSRLIARIKQIARSILAGSFADASAFPSLAPAESWRVTCVRHRARDESGVRTSLSGSFRVRANLRDGCRARRSIRERANNDSPDARYSSIGCWTGPRCCGSRWERR